MGTKLSELTEKLNDSLFNCQETNQQFKQAFFAVLNNIKQGDAFLLDDDLLVIEEIEQDKRYISYVVFERLDENWRMMRSTNIGLSFLRELFESVENIKYLGRSDFGEAFFADWVCKLKEGIVASCHKEAK